MKKLFWLEELGPDHKIKRTEDWGYFIGYEKIYGEMTRIRVSKEYSRVGINPLNGLPHKVR